MKKHFLLAFLCIYSCIVYSQGNEDTLYVAINEGLELLEQPIEGSNVKSKVNFNDQVIVDFKLFIDTIDLRVSRWLEVRTQDNRTGYVFGGFLNKHKLPTEQFSSIRVYIRELVSALPVLYRTNYLDKGKMEMDLINYETSGSNEFHEIRITGWEYGHTEIELYNWDLNEILNIITLSSYHRGLISDGNYVNIEFKLVRDSAENGRFDKFQWINGFDDPAEYMVLESRFPKGVRITMETE